MADDQEKQTGGRRFRLPKLFADASDDDAADAGGSSAPAAVTTSAATSASFAGGPRSAVGGAGSSDALTSGMERIYDLLQQMNERESAQEKVFNTLHQELMDYKKDFIYEHFKPVVRPLLFLYDSLEQFDYELRQHERPAGQEKRAAVAPSLVRQNVDYFREQLVEALRVCEVTIMERPEGKFVAKLHKALDTVPVDASQDGTIQRVVRQGWYLNGQLLRPAEVVVGKAG